MSVPVRWKMDGAVCDAYEAQKCGSSGLHGHHHFLMTLITRGDGIQKINGMDQPFEEGDLFVLSPADFHQNIVDEGKSFDYYGVKFLYELLDPRLAELCAPDQFPIHLHLTESGYRSMRTVFKVLVGEMQFGKDRIANQVYLQVLINQLFVLMLREMPQERSVAADTSFNRVLGYLYSHFHEGITVGEVAASMGYTTNYFNTRFRQAIGVPFGVCLRQIRLNYAKTLLVTGNMPVTEIAMEAGFGSLSHFSHRFREIYHMSPQMYRKKYRKEETRE